MMLIIFSHVCWPSECLPGKMFIQVSCPIFNWVGCFFTTEFYEVFFVFFEFLKYILDISLSNSGLQGQHLGLEGRIGFFLH